MLAAMNSLITTWPAFQSAWDGVRNFLLGGECVPFSFRFPEIAAVVDELRGDGEVRIGSGLPGGRLALEDRREAARALPLETMMEAPFSLAHYRLSRFDAPGRFLHGFREAVLERWMEALRRHGFTWERCYPIIFISGKGCATNYHMDFSHVLAWQITGEKRFCGLRDPDFWADRSQRLHYRPDAFARPAEMTEADALCFRMKPGDALWNTFLTPHWVEAGDSVAMSVNLSHGGLRLHGRLCRNEQELAEYRALDPERAPRPVTNSY